VKFLTLDDEASCFVPDASPLALVQHADSQSRMMMGIGMPISQSRMPRLRSLGLDGPWTRNVKTAAWFLGSSCYHAFRVGSRGWRSSRGSLHWLPTAPTPLRETRLASSAVGFLVRRSTRALPRDNIRSRTAHCRKNARSSEAVRAPTEADAPGVARQQISRSPHWLARTGLGRSTFYC
jgi:hypothetical protein